MSYDLYFKPRSGVFDEEGFKDYFRDRQHYQCEGGQAWYSNEDTGVYFAFEIQEVSESADPEDSEHYPVALNINFLRPSYFILEAEPEVSAFVKHFDLLVADPQSNGMGEGEYNAEQLVSGWNHGNEFGYAAILKDEDSRRGVFHLPTDQLRRAWKWNLSRSLLQENVGEAKFVPAILFMNLNGTTVTAAVWPDGIPVVVAPVDFLCVPRKDLAPARFFRKKEDTVFVSWQDALPMLRKHGTLDEDGSVSLNYEAPPSDVAKFVRSLPSEKRVVSGLPADKVLDREIYQRSIA